MKKEPLFFTDKTEIGAQHVPINNTKFDEGGQLFPNTEKLIEELIKNSDYSVSEIMTNKDGEKYRYHHWKLKYKSASNWLVKLFEKASTENTGKFYNTNFAYGDYSFYYDRPTLKNRPNGSMSMKKLEVIETLEKGGLIAPNGQPSGLYFTEIYNLVRTPEFKAWFGDWEEAYRTKNYDGVSKIIDENGEPLICVHNTPNEFTVFDRNSVGSTTDGGFYGKGFYFTPNVGQQRYGEKELNCFLNIKNPYLKQESHRSYELNTEDLESNGYDGVVVYPSWVEEFELESGVANCQEIVAYYPEQIKLADGTNTTFDGYSDDIRFKHGGSIENERIVCENCGWSWKVEDGGDDLYECHKCDHDNTPDSANKFASGGGIDINEPFDVNGKTLAERVRILVKQLYPDYKWSITSSYKTLDVYLLEADFDPFTEKWKQEYPDRELYYNVDNRDFEDYNRQNNAKITDRAVEVFKPIREYIDKFVYNRNANDPYADYVDYNVYEYTYIGKWDKPYKQVEPKAGKKKAKAPAPVTTTPTAPKTPFKKGDILAISQDKLNSITGSFAKRVASEIYFEVSKSISPFAQQLIKYDDQNNSEVIVVETNEILDDYVKATAPLFKTGDTVVNKLFPNNPNNPLKIKHRAYYQQTAVKYASLEKKFLLSGMYWNYELENGTYANEGELELYEETPSTVPNPTRPSSSNSTIIENLEVYNQDLGQMRWDVATDLAEKLGEGWRLPTKEEFINILYPNKAKIPNIKEDETYWSSIENDFYEAWFLFFGGGGTDYGDKNNENYVRLVRDVKQYTTPKPNNVFTIQNIVSKTQWSDGLKKTMIQDFVNSGYQDVTSLIGKRADNTSNNIQNKVDGFSSGKNTYLQANKLAEEIHKLIDAGNSPAPATPTENKFLEYLKQNNDNAGAVPQALEVTSSLALFIMASKDVENLDSKKYSELMDELLKPFTKKD